MPGSSPGMTPRMLLAFCFTDAIVKQPAFAALRRGKPTLRRPYSLRRRVRRSPTAASKRTERARDAKGPGRTQVYASRRKQKCSDPRTSTPRDIEACRSPIVPQVRRRNGVPRAVFEGLLRIAPGGQTFYPPLEGLLGAGGTYSPFGKSRPCGRRIAQVAACRATGTKRLGPPGGCWRRISDAPPWPPLPAPRLETLDQTALGHEGRMT